MKRTKTVLFLYNLITMELSKLIYKLADQYDQKKTSELFLDLDKTNEEKYQTKTAELKLDIDVELEELQTKLNDAQNVDEFEAIFDTIQVSLEGIYMNSNLNLAKLTANIKNPEIKEKLTNITMRRQMCSCD